MRLRSVLVAIAGLTALPSPAAAQGVDQTCLLVLSRFDPDTVNIAFPDDSAQYFGGLFSVAPGTQVVLRGRFPHARYMSFNVYDAQARPADGLSDVRLKPDPGSSNPFHAGADRTVQERAYTVRIVGQPAPQDPAARAPNTLYAGAGTDGRPNVAGVFLYRIYIPDTGQDITGGVGLPTATIEPEGDPGPPPANPSPCSTLDRPGLSGLNSLLAESATPADTAGRGPDPPVWRKFVNLVSSIGNTVTGSPKPGGLDLDSLGGQGGALSNVDNAYVTTIVERGHGQISFTRVKGPTYPDTRSGVARMPKGQLRYWSLCQNDPATQRFVACANDDRVVLDDDGFATFVVSTPAQRPANATKKCGVTWLPWGVSSRGALILRHMLPDATFGASVQAATVDQEVATMRDFFPVSRYYAAKADFEKLGCREITGSTPAARRACTSRRTVTITLPRGSRARRRVVLSISGRRARSVRVRRGGRVVVDLRGLPRGRNRIVVRASPRGRVIARRAFRTCVRRSR